MTDTVFRCSLCQKEHPALPPDPRPEIDSAKLEDLRARFYAAVDKLLASTTDPNDQLYLRAERMADAYFRAIRYTGVERVPDTLTTHGPEHRLRCTTECNK
jgi:hypothetical protein